jgi:hypothetical protein
MTREMNKRPSGRRRKVGKAEKGKGKQKREREKEKEK